MAKQVSAIDNVLHKFAELVIKRMESVQLNPTKGWFDTSVPIRPQNLSGRLYNNQNALMLFFLCAENNYSTSVFFTYNQAKVLGVQVKKGESAFPVYYPCPSAINLNTGEKIDIIKYNNLSPLDQTEYKVIFTPKYYNVFNIDQTNFAEKHPKRMERILAKFKPINTCSDTQYSHELLDAVIAEQKWLCPIEFKKNLGACYVLNKDYINLPEKCRFESGERFYSTFLHELTHSTGCESRLNREGFTKTDTYNYGRDELVAEFTAALLCVNLGINSAPQDHNIAYLQNWCQAMKENPVFLMSILSDVNKAEKMITTHLGLNQNINLVEGVAIQEKPILSRPQKSDALIKIEGRLKPQNRKVESQGVSLKQI